MKNGMMKMSMILLAIIGTLMGLGPLVLMASVSKVKDLNAQAFIDARRQLTTATVALQSAMAGIDGQRTKPSKAQEKQIQSLYRQYKSFGELVGRTDRMFRLDQQLLAGKAFVYRHGSQFAEARKALEQASQWVYAHISNYVECNTCMAHGVSSSDPCPQTNTPMLQIDRRGPDVEDERNVMMHDDEGNFTHMEREAFMRETWTAHGSNHSGPVARQWLKQQYDAETIAVVGATRRHKRLNISELAAIANLYEPVNPAVF